MDVWQGSNQVPPDIRDLPVRKPSNQRMPRFPGLRPRDVDALARALRHHASSSVSQYVKWLVSARPLERSWGVSALMLGPRLSFKNRRPIAELMCACIRLNVSQDRANVIQLMQRTGGWK